MEYIPRALAEKYADTFAGRNIGFAAREITDYFCRYSNMVKPYDHYCAVIELALHNLVVCDYTRMGRPILKIKLHGDERKELERRVRAPTTSKRDNLRAQIILLRSEEIKQQEVADRVGVSQVIVSKWTRRFIDHGLAGLVDAPGRGRKPSLPNEKVEAVITQVTQPPEGHTRWSVRTMAKQVGISRHASPYPAQSLSAVPGSYERGYIASGPCHRP